MKETFMQLMNKFKFAFNQLKSIESITIKYMLLTHVKIKAKKLA